MGHAPHPDPPGTMKLATLSLAAAALVPATHASDVLEVDAAGGAPFSTIQSAVAAAAPGDVVLVRAGAYSGDVTVTSGLTILGEGGVELSGHVTVQGLPASQFVLLSNVDLRPPRPAMGLPDNPGAVQIFDCDGRVRLQDCAIEGAPEQGDSLSTGTYRPGGPGLEIDRALDVAAHDCTLSGGNGGSGAVVVSGNGGDAVRARRTDDLALVRCVLRGGNAGFSDDGGDGGDAARIVGSTRLRVGYSAFFGGRGGDRSVFGFFAGDGGDGLRIVGLQTVTDFEGIYAGGPAGHDPAGTSGDDGAPIRGGQVQSLDGHPSALAAPTAIRTGEAWTLGVFALEGDPVRVLRAGGPGFAFRPRFKQPLLLERPAPRRFAPDGVVPAGGMLHLPYAGASLSAGDQAAVLWFQGEVRAGGRLTSPRAVVLLDSAF